MNTKLTYAWEAYEAGKDYKRRLGLYETVRQNERFYRGDQWHGASCDLPHPVFNIVRRITDYLVCSVIPSDILIQYTDDRLPFVDNSQTRAQISAGIEILNQNAAYRWKRGNLKALSQKALLDAAISGDAVFYCWWNHDHFGGQPFLGDIRTDLIHNTDLFVADVSKTDLQSQEYILLSGRASVSALRREAKENGCTEEEIRSIVADNAWDSRASDREGMELQGDQKATYLLRFFRENGIVIFEKSTKNCLIKRVKTGLRYYPVAYFNWQPAKGSFHGNAPVSDMIANQKYINTAYSMAMKHMYDTAFSKVIYDKSKIPEWSNEVGEAIAAVGGGNVADAVSVIGVGQMQDGYLDLINNVIDNTKNMMGATEAALGDAQAHNTSAILTLQQASQIALKQVSAEFCRCMSDLATIWADMLCTYCHPEQLLQVEEAGRISVKRPNYALLKNELLHASAQAVRTDGYTPALTFSLLDKLLEKEKISIEDYIELLPPGSVSNPLALLNKIKLKGAVTNE